MNKQTVLITGASQGIGASIAETFAEAGYNIVLNYRSHKEEALALAEKISSLTDVLPIQADIANTGDIDHMFEKALQTFGRIDVLVNNAGIHLGGPLTEIPLEQIQKEINTNLVGTIYCLKLALKDMAKYADGSIVNVTSIDGLVGLENCAVYSATKGGLHALTKALAKEYGHNGIRVNAVAPGAIATPMTSVFSENSDLADIFFKKSPIQRIGHPWEIAETVLFLASEKSSYITGQIISVDGGITLPYGGL